MTRPSLQVIGSAFVLLLILIVNGAENRDSLEQNELFDAGLSQNQRTNCAASRFDTGGNCIDEVCGNVENESSSTSSSTSSSSSLAATTSTEESENLVEEEHQTTSIRNGRDLGVEQLLLMEGDGFSARTARLQEARNYLREYYDVMRNNTNNTTNTVPVQNLCRNHYAECTEWAVAGECDNNPSFLMAFCAPVCFSCDMARLPDANDGDGDRQAIHNLLRDLGADLGAVQLTRGYAKAVLDTVEEARAYIQQLEPEELRDSCYVRHEECARWAIQGNCKGDDSSDQKKRMVDLCAPFCKSCHPSTTTSTSSSATSSILTRTDSRRPSVAQAQALALGADLGVIQEIFSDDVENVLEKIGEGRLYKQRLFEDDGGDPLMEKVRDKCFNQHESCTLWAIYGECEARPRYMHYHCPVACKSCHQLDFDTRCRRPDPNATDALGPWDLNHLFERVLTDPYYQQLEPVALSRPWYLPWDTKDNATYQIGFWLVQFENFITQEEADHLIQLGETTGYNRSTVVGKYTQGKLERKVNSSSRTSFTAWCKGECHRDPVHRRMIEKVEDLTGISETNYEYTQMPRYSIGQYYSEHHDYIVEQQSLPMGPRVLTFYIYLNDVEEGGGTYFPMVNFTVQPKTGRAVLWPSVDAVFPYNKDPRTKHAALPVLQGTKYGCNIWIHQRSFKRASANNCIG